MGKIGKFDNFLKFLANHKKVRNSRFNSIKLELLSKIFLNFIRFTEFYWAYQVLWNLPSFIEFGKFYQVYKVLSSLAIFIMFYQGLRTLGLSMWSFLHNLAIFMEIYQVL